MMGTSETARILSAITSPDTTGIIRSRTTRSKLPDLKSSHALAPLPAVTTSNPAVSSAKRMIMRICGSSSTTRARGASPCAPITRPPARVRATACAEG